MLAASARRRTRARGLGFGVLVWAISDNVIVPAFKLAGWPQRYPLESHAYAIAAHLACGAAVDTAMRGLTSLAGHA